MLKAGSHLVASMTPIEDLELIAAPGQPESKRRYREGYENFFNEMPVLALNDKLMVPKEHLSKEIMQTLAQQIRHDDWLKTNYPGDGAFARTIIALEHPEVITVETPSVEGEFFREGPEMVVAHWGTGFSSPVHGHAPGYMHEEVLDGKILVNTYRMVHPRSLTVRLVKTEIVGKGTFVSEYNEKKGYHFKRPILIHNFTALEPTNTLHYLPEHTREGRDNGFEPEYFEKEFNLDESDLIRIDAYSGMYLAPGDVALVRSTNVPEYGDHFIVITGPPVVKEHGTRPQDVAIAAPYADLLLDKYDFQNGLILLKLNAAAKKNFHAFHGITMTEDHKVIMPSATALTENIFRS